MNGLSDMPVPSCGPISPDARGENGVSERSGVYNALLVERGRFTLRVNGRRTLLRENELFVITPEMYFHGEESSPDCLLRVLRFSPALAQSGVSFTLPVFFTGDAGGGVFSAAFTESSGIARLFENASGGTRDVCGELALNSAAFSLLAAVLRVELQKVPDAAARNSVRDRIAEVTAAVGAAPAQSEEKALAQTLGMSYSYFSRSFKAVMGMGFNEYVGFVRINEAKRLLCTQGTDIAALAERLGYSSASHFINAFRKATGISPGQYKKTLMKLPREKRAPSGDKISGDA